CVVVAWSVGGAVGGAVGGPVGWAVAWAMSWAMDRTIDRAVEWVIDLAEDSFTTVLILLTLGFGASVGTGIIAGFLNPLILLALTGTSLPTLSMLLYSPLKTRKLITKYRKTEESLIKP
ncbi:MAG: serine/threonine protein kinase, partial [Nostoc sp.]